MEQQIKQRLVGAVVLVALAVIFLPMVLNGPAVSESGAIPHGVPPEPTPSAPPALTLSSAPPTVLPLEGEVMPAPATKAKEPSPAQPAPAPKITPKPAPKPAAKAAVDSPLAWSVQVGSFTERDKAYRLRDRLRNGGYATYVVDPKGDSRYFKVRVGPELDQARAREAMKRLAAEKKIKGFIVKHQ